MGGTITSDVAVFTKLKKLALYSMELDGKIGSTLVLSLFTLSLVQARLKSRNGLAVVVVHVAARIQRRAVRHSQLVSVQR